MTNALGATKERDRPTEPYSLWMENEWTRPWLEWQKQLWAEHPLGRLIPLDPIEVCRALVELTESLATQPALLEKHLSTLVFNQLRLGLWTLRQLRGDTVEEPIATATKDRRFQDEDWSELLPFSVLRQWYLLWSKWFAATSEDFGGSPEERQRVGFYLRQWLDALSPANFPATNPAVLRETLASGGENLQRGMQNLLDDLKRGSISVVPQDRFKPGDNLALTPGQVVYRNELMELIQYAPVKKKSYAVPMLIVPPWINRYYVLDMRPGMSLVEYLVGQGFTVFVISWRNPAPTQENINLEDYLRLGSLEALKVVKAITGSRKVNLVGYCIGGTLLGITLAYLGAKRDTSVASATFLTSLLDFEEVGETSIFISDEQLAEIKQRMEAKGYLSAEEISAIFRLMRSNDLIWNFVVNNYLLGKEPPAFELMHWSVDGTRLPRAMHEYYLYNMYLQNNLSKPDTLKLLGKKINLGRVRCPSYIVAGSEDHIVPWRAAFKSAALLSGPVRFVRGSAGHITTIVCPPDAKPGTYLVNDAEKRDAEAWEQSATRQQGSWWPDWVKWLKKRSGEKETPPTLGNERYQPLEPAPGRYVLEV